VSSNTLTMPALQGMAVITPAVNGYSVRRYYDPQTGQFLTVDPAVDQTGQPYAYVNGDPVDATDPLGLGLGDLLNPWSPDNPIRQWASGGSLASNILYLNPAFPAVAAYGAEAQAWEDGCSLWTVAGYGAAGTLGLASLALWFPSGAALPVAEEGSALVEQTAQDIRAWVGDDARLIRNDDGDTILISKDGTRRVRFDVNRPYPHESPHAHIEELVNGKWQRSGPIYPMDVPQR
jgi:hypothetical protein